MKKRINNIFIALTLIIGCTKEEVTPRIYPRVLTIEAFNVTSEGASLKGQITFSSVQIKDHGFVLSDQLHPLIGVATTISNGPGTGTGIFEARFERGLEEGKKYYFRAYAVSEDFVVYGNTVEFISLGSKAPILKDFFPIQGTWGDTITIIGENFSDISSDNKIKFGEVTTTPFRSTKDTLYTRVPGEVAIEKTTVSVSMFGNVTSLSSKQFTLKAPVIESISPPEGAAGTQITLTGKFFNSLSTKVFFNGVESLTSAKTQTSVTAIAPTTLLPGAIEVKVVTGSGSMYDVTSFTVKSPELIQLSPSSAGEGDEIKLIGNFFSSDKASNVVTFGGVNAIVTSASQNELKVIVPPDVNSIEADVKVKSGNSESGTVTFSFLAPVIESFTPQQGSTGTEIIITGKNFKTGSYNKAFVGSQELSYVYAVSPTELHGHLTGVPAAHTGKIKVTFLTLEGTSTSDFRSPWIQLNDFPGTPLYHSRTLIYNNSVYVGFGGEPMSNQFWRFDPSNKQWTQLSSFPGTQRNAPAMFTVGSKGYVGAGENFKDFWEYNFSNNTWTQKANLPMTGTIGFGFTLNNTAYLTENNMVNTKIWKYDVSTDSWSIVSTSPVIIFDYTPYFVIGNSAYIMGYSELWKFDGNDQWTTVAQNPTISPGICFSVGGFGYGLVSGGLMYKLNPISGTWTEDYYPLEYYDVVSAVFSVGGKAYLVNYNRVFEYEPAP